MADPKAVMFEDTNPWAKQHLRQREEERRRIMEQWQQYQGKIRPPTPPLTQTIGSANVVGGTLHLCFTDGTQIDIPMAVVSEIVAVVLAGRLAMGFGDAVGGG